MKMRWRFISLYRVLLFLCLASIAALIWIFVLAGSYGYTQKAVPESIIGQYSIDGQKPRELTKDIELNSREPHTVKISGHFSSAIPKDCVLALLLDNIRVTIRINGREVYSALPEESAPVHSKTYGNQWGFYISPGISREDRVDITLQNIYNGTLTNVFDEFLNNMSYGHGFELYQTMIREKTPSMLFGLSVFSIGIIILLLCAAAGLLKVPGMARSTALAFVTMIGGLWIFIDEGYPYVSLLFGNPQLFNLIDVLQIFVISVALVIFALTCLEKKETRRIVRGIAEASLVLLIGAVWLQITGLYDLYEIQNWAIAIGSFAVSVSFILLGYEAMVIKHKRTLFTFLSWMPLLISAFIEALNFYFRFMPMRGAIQYGFILSVLLQCIQLVRILRENVERRQKDAQLEYELLQSKMAVMLSQIQPHFLFNTLNDIRFLYREAPEQAENVLVSFTRYLRGNMESLNQVALVPFEQELSHVKNYVEIEKSRFGNRLNVVFDLPYTQFFIPVLTVQPLVENAIRHGVIQKREGGTVVVRTAREEHAYVIEVSDDGVGFDPSAGEGDGRAHIGIENVRKRLQSMCGGTLVITSRVGVGTVLRIHIPISAEAAGPGLPHGEDG